jgi:hypothetical protein
VSARRLKGLGPLLLPGTSLVVAWADGPSAQQTVEQRGTIGSRRLVLRFVPLAHGAVLEV